LQPPAAEATIHVVNDTVKGFLASILPTSIRRARRDFLIRRRWKSLEKLPPRELFRVIYADGIWGSSGDPNEQFFSGTGSHDTSFVETYYAAVEKFVRRFPQMLTVADLGCGDFAIGSRLRPLFSKYTACDVVEPLIERNRQRFASLDVDFRVVDLTTDPLPPADVVIIRQVLQHLSNAQIQAAIAKIPHAYRYLILSEHLPFSDDFVPNLDKPAGPHTRLDSGGPVSGVVLTAPPFNLKPNSSTPMCEVRDFIGIIRTTLYEFR
jgi:2-polyprenyl-3-methyl-5-hydroxy-6-metoxy-1,4-benzoquinol methylase